MQSKTPFSIPVRRMNFAFPDMQRHWYKGNPWITHFLNAMSAVFPDGERFFMHSVRLYEKQITDPVLRQQIRSFIGQEANHGKEHEGFNKAITKQNPGIHLNKLMRFTYHGLEYVKKIVPKPLQLSMTVGFEHFTAILAHQTLKHSEDLASVGGVYYEIFMWHAVEETEHKAVAYDVYQAVDGRYWLRIGGMLISTTMFLGVIPAMALTLIAADHRLTDWRAALGLVKFLLVEPGIYAKIIPDYVDYYRPDFHPWMHDNRALVADRIKQLTPYEVLTKAA